jgi:tetratricopeptide (TPR) repeat protein
MALERGIQVAHEANLQTLGFHGIAAFLGETYLATRRSDLAMPLLERVIESCQAIDARCDYFLAPVGLSEVYVQSGRAADALDVLTRAEGVARTYRYRGCHARILAGLAALRTHPDLLDLEDAETRYRQALRLAEELGMRPLQAHCHLGLGKLYSRTGRVDEARTELTTAVAMLRELGMVHWLPEAEDELTRAAGISSS